MKVLLYASLTANGLMMKADPAHAPPPEVMADFVDQARRAGSLILGRVTYDLMASRGAGSPFAGIEIVVVSKSGRSTPGAQRVGSPAAALDYLSRRGLTHALLGGGALLYSAFLAEKLVNELCVNTLPILSSGGSPITAAPDPQWLEVVGSRQLAANVSQLRFAVRR